MKYRRRLQFVRLASCNDLRVLASTETQALDRPRTSENRRRDVSYEPQMDLK
jgi:hypothetical protein